MDYPTYTVYLDGVIVFQDYDYGKAMVNYATLLNIGGAHVKVTSNMLASDTPHIIKERK